jgi:hypothetical protein
MFSVTVFGPPTNAVESSTKLQVSSTKVASPVVGVSVRACSFMKAIGWSLDMFTSFYI